MSEIEKNNTEENLQQIHSTINNNDSNGKQDHQGEQNDGKISFNISKGQKDPEIQQQQKNQQDNQENYSLATDCMQENNQFQDPLDVIEEQESVYDTKKDYNEFSLLENFKFTPNFMPNRIVSMIFIAILLVYIIQDYFTNWIFFEKSQQFMHDIQKNYKTESGWKGFNEALSNGCLVLMGLLIAAMVVFNKSRLRFISFALYFVFCTYLMSLFKLFYHQLRPYQQFDNVFPIECAKEFGNPSGHAMLNLFAYIIIPYLNDRNFYKFRQDLDRSKISWIKIVATACNIIFILLIGFSRMYLGVHSPNQVILGYCYGLLFALLYFDYLEYFISKFLLHLLYCDKETKKKHLIYQCIALIVLLGITIGSYELIKNIFSSSERDQAYLEIIAECNLPDFKQNNAKFLYNKCFVDAGLFSGVFAITLCFLQSQGIQFGPVTYRQQFNLLSAKQIAIRAVIFLVPAAFTFLPGFILGHFLFEDDSYLKFFISMFLSVFAAIYVLLFLSPVLLKKFNLEIKGDFLYISENRVVQN